MKLYITVTEILGKHEFEMETDVNPELPWHDFVRKIKLVKILDKDYPNWQSYDINIDLGENSDEVETSIDDPIDID